MCYSCGKYGNKIGSFTKVKENKYCSYFKKIDTLLNNVTAIRSMVQNACTVIIRVTKKRSAGRNENMTNRY